MARLVEVDDSPKLVKAGTEKKDLPESNKSYESGKRDLPGWKQGFASALQGPTFGFYDEIGGLVGGIKNIAAGGSFSEGYRNTRDILRGAADSQSEDSPISTAVTRSLAAAPTFLLQPFRGVQALQGAGMVPRIANAGATGALFGGVSGAGGSDADTPMGVAIDAAKSAGTGGALGAASVPAAGALGAVYRSGASMVSDKVAQRYGQEKIAEALTRDARGTVVQNDLTAPLAQAVRRFDKLGPEARIVDAGGQNTRSLLDTLTILPGRAKDATENAIRSRQAGRADRLIGSATNALGTGGQRAAGVIDDLIETRATAATPLYGRLYRMEVEATPGLARILAGAEQLGATKNAQSISTAAFASGRVSSPYSLSHEQWAASGGRLKMQDLDHVKQGLDMLYSKQVDKVTGEVSPLGREIDGLRRKLLEELDGATNGLYRQARDAFAGPSALIDATRKGKLFFSADDAATRGVLDGMSLSEQEAFRLGAFEALRNKLGRPGGQTEVMGMWKDKILREKLQTIFPNERAFREFASDVAKEARLKGIEGIGRGSQTAPRQMALGDLDVSAVQDVGGMIGGASQGNIPSFLLATSNAWNRVKTPEPVRDAMAQSLLRQGPSGRAGLLELEDIMRQVNANRSGRAAMLGTTTGGLLAPAALQ